MVRAKFGAEATQRACPSCGEQRGAWLLQVTPRRLSHSTFTVVRCTRCDLVYTTPLPTSSDLASLYDQQFYGVAPSQPRTFWEPLRHALHLFVLEQRRRALLGRPPGIVLDVGCGDGDFLAFLQRHGWKGVGTEYSPDACALARRKGVRVIQGELREAALPPDSLDVVTLWHVLEHLPQPLEALQEVHRLLRGDGLLVVEVPCITSPTFRLCGESWFPLDVPRHLQHFSQQTLTRLLARAGFTPVRWQHYHLTDAALACISFLDKFGGLGRLGGTHYFLPEYRRASAPARLRFLVAAALLAGASLPYSALATALSGSGETLTVTARKAASVRG